MRHYGHSHNHCYWTSLFCWRGRATPSSHLLQSLCEVAYYHLCFFTGVKNLLHHHSKPTPDLISHKIAQNNEKTTYTRNLILVRKKATDLKTIFKLHMYNHIYNLLFVCVCVVVLLLLICLFFIWVLTFNWGSREMKKQGSKETMMHPIASNMLLFIKTMKFRKTLLTRWPSIFCSFISHSCNVKKIE